VQRKTATLWAHATGRRPSINPFACVRASRRMDPGHHLCVWNSLSKYLEMSTSANPDWERHGIRIVRASQLDSDTPQTAGMTRAEAISHAKVGAQKLWAGTVVVHPQAKTGPHHHGELETVIYIVSGRARFRWGDDLEFVEEAGPGDFIYVPPYVPHQELNARSDIPVQAVVVRSGQEPVVFNLDIPSPEDQPRTDEPDPFHSRST
jgi:uncharacterized RmlC-like cupin family protein